jgi:integrase
MKPTIERKIIEVLPAGSISGAKTAPKDIRESKDIKATKDLVNPSDFARTEIIVVTRKRKSTKGLKKTSDYVDYETAMRAGMDLIWTRKHSVIGFYIVFAVNSGLRTGDIQEIKYSDLVNKKVGDVLVITEEKTKKTRNIQINDKIFEAFNKNILPYHLENCGGRFRDAYIFRSQKGTTFRTISLNRILKEVFKGVAPVISTHSLRKSFGRRVYENNNRSEYSLLLLSDIFAHSSPAITRRYLGLRREEIASVYLNL